MSKAKEFWRRNGDDRPKLRMFDRCEHMFYACIRTTEKADGTLVLEYPVTDDDRFIVQLCTECKDKAGRLIYEGDILETDEAGWKGVVVFGEGRFSLEDSKGGFSAEPNWSGCKIIGNVYQDPELIP